MPLCMFRGMVVLYACKYTTQHIQKELELLLVCGSQRSRCLMVVALHCRSNRLWLLDLVALHLLSLSSVHRRGVDRA